MFNYILYIFSVTYITYILLLTKTSFAYNTPLQVVFHINGELNVRPFGLIDWIIVKCTNWYDKFSEDSYEMKDTYFTYLMRCPYCLSMWVNIPFLYYLYSTSLMNTGGLGLMIFSTPLIVGYLVETCLTDS